VDAEVRDRFAKVIVEIKGKESQRDFCERLGISQGALVYWKKGNLPGLEMLAKIAAFRGQLPEQLLAEVYGRGQPSHINISDLVEVMTQDQLIDLLALIASKLKKGGFDKAPIK
jgi:transcriptional regulator with XRE-family HTH domain